jgi:beta-lactamase class D
MKPEFKKIYHDMIPHSSFLSEASILSCMYQSYQLGTEDIIDWLSKMDYLNKDVNSIKSEWFKSHDLQNPKNPQNEK